jgi:hypothetical protein
MRLDARLLRKGFPRTTSYTRVESGLPIVGFFKPGGDSIYNLLLFCVFVVFVVVRGRETKLHIENREIKGPKGYLNINSDSE